jgi:hypothetical protein
MINMIENFLHISKLPKWFIPFILGSGVFMIAKWLDGQISLAFREDCRKFICEKKYESYLGILPDLVNQAFERTFGTHQGSINCFVRAAAFSTAMLLVTFFITEMFNPSALWGVVTFLWALGWKAMPLTAAAWFLTCLVPSWLMIGKTRFIIWVLQRARVTLPMLVLIMVIDLIIGSWVFLTIAASGAVVMGIEEAVRTAKLPANGGVLSVFAAGSLLTVIFVLIGAALLLPTGQLYLNVPIGNLFWASCAPSVWLWLYIIAAITTRLLVRSVPALRIASYVLDVEIHPVKAMGLVAAIIVTGISLICVAIGAVIF